MSDILVASDSMDYITIVKDGLHAKSQIKDLKTLRYFLGIKIARSPKGYIFVNANMHLIYLLIQEFWAQNL